MNCSDINGTSVLMAAVVRGDNAMAIDLLKKSVFNLWKIFSKIFEKKVLIRYTEHQIIVNMI